MFEEISGQRRQQELEERVLSRWKERNVFRRALERRADAPRFTFYEGPPTANGRPGIHHVLARTLKDVICRYRDLTGYLVERKAGWDTHGLPVEVEVEKALKIHGKDAIRAYGLEEFAHKCIESVFQYTGEWERLTDRIGYWLDLSQAYVTYHESYVESVWWSLKELFTKGHLYQGHKVVWWWPEGGTALSSAEVGLGYRETADPSVTVRFPLSNPFKGHRANLLAWTTTPWTLPSNCAIAVGEALRYQMVSCDGNVEIVAENLVATVFGKRTYTVLETFGGADLVGLTYEPPFAFAKPAGGRAHVVVGAAFVTTENGTGLVHLAPAFGEDDAETCKVNGIGFLQLLHPNGTMTEECGPFAGMKFKEADRPLMKDLADRGLLFERGQYLHEYPFCWRAASDPLIQYARRSWFIRTSAVKDALLQNNDSVRWFPETIRDGRFGDFLRNNVDWALSRERFWGTPLPIWVNDVSGKMECLGSVQELLDRNPAAFAPFDEAQAKNPSLSSHLRVHKPWIDDVTYEVPGEAGVYRRVPEVIDCWYDSGAMPFAQRHYPFENRELFEASFPADYICEGLDQTRGWFYSLLAISTLLFGKAPYRTVMVNGLVNDREGKKMSKSLGNTVNPWEVIEHSGADPTRWYLLAGSPPWLSKSFDLEGVADIQRRVFGTLWPSFNFFAMYANLDGWTKVRGAPAVQSRGAMDRWLLSRTQSLLRDYRAAMEQFDPMRATRLLGDFIVDELSNWYIRRNRARFWKEQDQNDKNAAYATLHQTLHVVASLLAPIAPMSADALFLGLYPTNAPADSVHLMDMPTPDLSLIDDSLEAQMAAIIAVVRLGRAARESARIKVRQPLPLLVAAGKNQVAMNGLLDPELAREVADELNVKELLVVERSGEYCSIQVKPNLPVLGKQLGKRLSRVKEMLQSLTEKQVSIFEETGVIELLVDGETLSLSGDALLVERTGKPGYAVAAEGGYMAALDTTLNEALIQEGVAREFINRIQNHRKKMGLSLSTRIRLLVNGPAALVDALMAHRARVAEEVLATDIVRLVGQPPEGGQTETYEIDGAKVEMTLVPGATG